ncbi:hypothetical protein C8Q80DRAFT_1090443 [Daedaleopsis nitida]|nr:hypothetical protein C8Q80DRAFT_1090443 [Daedaleopsis nitida]
MNGEAKALYRSCLRQIGRLPTEYLRQFFRLKVADDVRAALGPKFAHLRSTKLRRVHKDLRKLEGANAGHVSAFRYIVETAYGRRGQLKWEIVQPLRTEPREEPPPRIIRSVESSRPPVWSTEMKALVTSEHSRVKRALKPQTLLVPNTIPAERLDPNSPQSRILGPFSKRREVNARWKFFLQELQKTHYPLQTVLQPRAASDDSEERRFDSGSLARAGIRSIGLQGSGVFEEAEALACPPALVHLDNNADVESTAAKRSFRPTFESHLPQRFLRRRYQQLLAQTPVLTYLLSERDNSSDPVTPSLAQASRKPGHFNVALSPNASRRLGIIHSTADSIDMAWIQQAQVLEGNEMSKGKKRVKSK